MGNNFEEPREFDVVKGGQAPPPVSSAVLGGVEGLRQRFVTGNEQVRLDAVVNAPIYGNEGLDVLVKALKDASLQVRIKTYQILKESNQALEETAKGLRLNVGDKIYCVYSSSLSYGDDWYYLIDYIHDYYDEDYNNKCYGEYELYEPLLNGEDGYLHYITDIKDKINIKNPYYWIGYCDQPSLNSFHVDINKAHEAAKCLHRQQLIELDKKLGKIECHLSHDKEQLNQWCQDNNLSLNSKKNEYFCEFQARIFRALQKKSDIELLNKFWEYTVSGRLAFVVELIIDRKCYLQATCLNV